MEGFVVMPAIDIRGGKCVRLVRGDFSLQTVYEEDPMRAAMRWANEGARWLHIVDLDGAVSGEPKNIDSVRRIRSAVDCKLQFGGGARRLRDIEWLFSLGVDRVVLGTAAVSDIEMLKEAVGRWHNQIAVAIDVKDGMVTIKGWTERTSIEPLKLIAELERVGVATIVYTDVLRDGTMVGPNLSAIEEIALATSVRIIASGGISEVEHVVNLIRLYPKVLGCVVGKALYEGKLNYKDAIKAVEREMAAKGGGENAP